MQLDRKSLLYAIPGVILLVAAIFADGLPWNSSNGFGYLRAFGCVIACILIWWGLRRRRSPLTLMDLKNAVFKFNCALLVGLICLGAVEALAYMVVKAIPATTTSADRSEVFRLAEESAYAPFDWAPEHKRNVRDFRSDLVYQPYSLWSHEPQKSTTLNIDNKWGGIRRTICSNAGETNKTLEVFMFGGSTLLCLRSPDVNTVASEVASELQRRYPDHAVRVVNFGLPGYISDQEVVRLTQVISEGAKPDIVIFYDGVNEKFNKVASGIPHSQFERFKSIESYHGQGISHIVRQILRYDYVHRAAASLFPSGQQTEYDDYCQDEPKLQHRANRMAIRFHQNVDFVSKLGVAYGFEPVHFWQPDILNTGKSLSGEETAVLHDVRADRLSRAFRISDDVITKRMKGVANFYNISNSLDHIKQSVFFDFCHVSAIANRAVAKAIVEKLHEGGHLARIQ